MDLCNLQLHNIFYEITKASLALGVRDYTGTIWPNNLYYYTLISQSRLNGNQFKPEPAARIFHSCSSLCIAKLCLENLSLEILWFYQQSLRFQIRFERDHFELRRLTCRRKTASTPVSAEYCFICIYFVGCLVINLLASYTFKLPAIGHSICRQRSRS